MKFTETHCEEVGHWYAWGQVYRVSDVEACWNAKFHVYRKVFWQIIPLQDKIHEKSKKRLSE